MRLNYIVAAAAGLALGLFAFVIGSRAQELPPPSAGSIMARSLLQPKGMTIGPDGQIYVAESGTGGDTDFTVGSGENAVKVKNGFTGRISKWDPETGTPTTVAAELPSTQ